jgi:uncharacterized membrane protein YraQ (UPF0718 family)
MSLFTEFMTLAAVLRVQEQDVGEVLLLLGIGIPVAGIVGALFHSWRMEGIGNLIWSGAMMAILPFLMLSCQAATG